MQNLQQFIVRSSEKWVVKNLLGGEFYDKLSSKLTFGLGNICNFLRHIYSKPNRESLQTNLAPTGRWSWELRAVIEAAAQLLDWMYQLWVKLPVTEVVASLTSARLPRVLLWGKICELQIPMRMDCPGKKMRVQTSWVQIPVPVKFFLNFIYVYHLLTLLCNFNTI